MAGGSEVLSLLGTIWHNTLLPRMQINGLGERSTGGGSTSGSAGSPRRAPLDSQMTCAGPGAVRRSRSQGTRKLQKCLSRASYSEDHLVSSPSPTAQPMNNNASCYSSNANAHATSASQATLVGTRQYCSFGSKVTSIRKKFKETINLKLFSPFLTIVRYMPIMSNI